MNPVPLFIHNMYWYYKSDLRKRKAKLVPCVVQIDASITLAKKEMRAFGTFDFFFLYLVHV